MSLKISHKGLILVSIPLLFELLSFGALFYVVQEAQQQALREARSRAVVAEATNLHKCFLDAGMALAIWKFTRNPQLIQKYDQAVAPIPDGFRKLKELSVGTERQDEHVRLMEEKGNQILNLLSTHGRPTNEGTSGFTMAVADWNVYRKLLASYLESFETELQLLVNQERLAQDQYKHQSDASQTTLKVLFAVLTVVSILITLCLAAFFTQSIRARLNVLRDNASRVAARKPLNPPVAGEDEIRDLDLALHDMTRQLRAAEQRKEEFASMLSHDLRTPLCALQITLALVLEGTYGDLSEQGVERLTYAESNLSGIINLVNQLVDLDKIESGNLDLRRERRGLKEICTRAASAVFVLAEEKEIEIVRPGEDAKANVDAERMLEVVINLLANAIKFSPAGSKVTLNLAGEGAWTVLSVEDQGPGIPPSQQSEIFTRYRQLDEDAETMRKGSGLGLWICKAITEAHGGTIGVDSDGLKGSRFWVRLPSDA